MSIQSISGLHHIALEVSDLEKSAKFYREFIGLKITERHEENEVPAIPVKLMFMRFGQKSHHDFVLVHNPNKKYRAPTEEEALNGPPGFHHIAFECVNRDEWLKMKDKTEELGIDIVRGPVVHSAYHPEGEGSWGENESFYVFDPDGHRLEIFCDMASIDEDGTFVDFSGKRIEEAKVLEV